MSLFRDFLEGFPPPPLTGLSSKCHNFFSIWSLLSLEKYVRQKYSLCLFSKKILSLSVSHHFYSPFSKNWVLFAKNCVYWRETDKLQKIFLNESLNDLDVLFHPLVVLKASNLKELWLFKHTPMMGKMEDFFDFSKKSSNLH